MFRNGNFVNAGNKFWFPDDVTLGYIIGKMKNIFLSSLIGSFRGSTWSKLDRDS